MPEINARNRTGAKLSCGLQPGSQARIGDYERTDSTGARRGHIGLRGYQGIEADLRFPAEGMERLGTLRGTTPELPTDDEWNPLRERFLSRVYPRLSAGLAASENTADRR